MVKIQRSAVALVVLGMLILPATANALAGPVSLGSAASFAVLGGSTVTNTGPTLVTGDLGVSPGTAVTGFPPGVLIGTLSAGDAVAAQAQVDLTSAYNNAAGQAPDAAVSALGGLTLTPGVYSAPSSMGLTGTLTLDAQGDPNALWLFQAGSTLTTASASTVRSINGAQSCNVFWQIGSSATLGTNSNFGGSILALTSITVTTGVTIDGRALAINGAVTMDTNAIARSECAVVPEPTPTPTPTPTRRRHRQPSRRRHPSRRPSPPRRRRRPLHPRRADADPDTHGRADPDAEPRPDATATPTPEPTAEPTPTPSDATLVVVPVPPVATPAPEADLVLPPVGVPAPTPPATDTSPIFVAGPSDDVMFALVAGASVFLLAFLLDTQPRRRDVDRQRQSREADLGRRRGGYPSPVGDARCDANASRNPLRTQP